MSEPSARKREGGLNPVTINDTVWYYEDHKSLHFIVECCDEEGNYHRTLSFHVPARKLKASLRRMGAL